MGCGAGCRKQCIVLCHCCHIYGTSKSKEMGEHFKVIIWGGKPQKKWTAFMGGFSLCKTAILKLYCKS